MVLMSLPTFDKVSDLNEGLRFTEYFSFFCWGVKEGCLSFLIIWGSESSSFWEGGGLRFLIQVF